MFVVTQMTLKYILFTVFDPTDNVKDLCSDEIDIALSQKERFSISMLVTIYKRLLSHTVGILISLSNILC